MKTISSAILLAITAFALAPSVSFGQQSTNAYVLDCSGNPVMGRYGDCVRSRFWTPSA